MGPARTARGRTRSRFLMDRKLGFPSKSFNGVTWSRHPLSVAHFGSFSYTDTAQIRTYCLGLADTSCSFLLARWLALRSGASSWEWT